MLSYTWLRPWLGSSEKNAATLGIIERTVILNDVIICSVGSVAITLGRRAYQRSIGRMKLLVLYDGTQQERVGPAHLITIPDKAKRTHCCPFMTDADDTQEILRQ